jgi:hypothetical protein
MPGSGRPGGRRRGLRRRPALRAELEARAIGDVLAVACGHRVHLDAGGPSHRADALVGQVPAPAWQQVSCAKGAKGHRLYDWAFIRLHHDDHDSDHPPPAGLVGVTCNQIQHLFAAVVAIPTGDVGNRLRWSGWRRRHQSRARTCHYRRQATQQP